jgi:hypothetical protein
MHHEILHLFSTTPHSSRRYSTPGPRGGQEREGKRRQEKVGKGKKKEKKK